MTDHLTPYRPQPVTLRGGADPAAVRQIVDLVSHATGENDGTALLRIALAESVGLSLGQALQDVHMIKGRPTLSATAQLALARRAGVRTRWVESTDEVATLRLWVPGDPEPVDETYSSADARRAGLNSPNWKAHPRAMLRARCTTAAIRAHCPEVLGGAVYDADELQAIDYAGPPEPPRQQRPRPERQAARAEAITIEEPQPAQQPPAQQTPPKPAPKPPWQDLAAQALPPERVPTLGPREGWDRDAIRAEVQAIRAGAWEAACMGLAQQLRAHGWDDAMIDGELAEQGWTEDSYQRACAAVVDLRDGGGDAPAEAAEAPAPDEAENSLF